MVHTAETVVKLVPENAEMNRAIERLEYVRMVANLGISSLTAMKVSLKIYLYNLVPTGQDDVKRQENVPISVNSL